MDAYDAYPNFPVLAGNFPVLQNIFPVNLRREFRKKSLQHSGFVQRNWLLRAQKRKIPCYSRELQVETGSHMTAHTTKLFKHLAVSMSLKPLAVYTTVYSFVLASSFSTAASAS